MEKEIEGWVFSEKWLNMAIKNDITLLARIAQ